MYPMLLLTHSLVRYFILIFLIWVIIKSFSAWRNNGVFSATDEKANLWLLILSHIQLLLGLGLYASSGLVQFSSDTMKNPVVRYWTVEHIFMMIIAIVLITLGRISSKKITDSQQKGKRLFWYNALALLIIVVAILTSDRGFFTLRTA
jgi:hypothetical protein